MKKLFLLAFLIGSTSVISAQSELFKVTKSQLFKDEKKHTELVFSEEDGNGGVITVRKFLGGLLRTPKGYYVEHYSNTLKLLSQTEIEVDKSEINGILVKENKVHLIEKRMEEGNIEVNVLTSDMDKLEFSSRQLLHLDKEDIKKYFGVYVGPILINSGFGQMDSDLYGAVDFSDNKKYMSITFDIKDKENEVHRIFVFNDAFEQVYTADFLRDIKDRYFDFVNVTVDGKDGSVFLLGKAYEGESRRSKKKGKINYHYELHKVSATGEKSLSFITGERFVASLTSLKSEKYLSCVGFFSDEKENRYKGVVRFDINTEDMSMIRSSFQPFTEEFIMDKYGKKKEKELTSLSYRDIFFLEENGDIVLNAEEFFITTNYNMNTGTSYTYYNYFDIVSARISESGKLLWARNINKKQSTPDPVFNAESFTTTVKDNKVYIFLNGSEKVKKIRNNRIEFKDASAKNYNLYVIEIDEAGEFRYKILQTSDQLTVPLYVSKGVLINNSSEVIFLGRKNSNKQLLKVGAKPERKTQP